ncbi:MAG: CHAP domain-containing protein [Eubacterium sp.]|nr:CHAP domain-containing protein [Eubacterium sp.]
MAKKKTLLIIPIIIILTIIISALTPTVALANTNGYEPRLTAPSQSIPYYSSAKNVYAQTGTPMPNCVAYAYGRIYEMNGEAPLITHGSAGDWYGMNKANGYYDYGSEPKQGAVACWSGHVAIVEKINKDGSVTISESHWGGTYFDVRTYEDMSSHYGQQFYGYIYTYNEGLTKSLEKRLLNAKKETHKQYKQEKIESPEQEEGFNIITPIQAKKSAEKKTAPKKETILDRIFK